LKERLKYLEQKMPPAKYFEENATSKIFRTKNATRKSKTKKMPP